ncbi:MAG: hypothetical protein CL840_12430 [Crocinitomicaceae bacterium]|nr:hypothetical protein [Crocinitomicaceae bacterium]|tara:strand:- start:9251 stop:9895 length:645 start_codon:yes stop_codon:yes gene_type:complete
MSFSLAISDFRTPFKKNSLLIGMVLTFVLLWASTLFQTTDLNNWFLENLLVILFLSVLSLTYSRYKFSDLSYLMIFVYLCLHIHGAMHTYAEAPIGYWLSDALSWSRNNYDRIVHFSFGFLLAYPMREVFLNILKVKRWVAWLLPMEITLSFSGMYEIIEWSVADLFFPEQGVAYLGTQGDIWDAQKDMALAFLGSILITIIVLAIRKAWRIET